MKAERLWLLIAWTMAAGLISAEAAVPNIDVEVDAGITSAFVWRGRVISDEPCLQPSIEVKLHDVSFNVWGTWDMSDIADFSQYIRTDASVNCTYPQGRHVWTYGLTTYSYDDEPGGQPGDTAEVFLCHAMDIVGLPSLTIYRDFGEIDGFYASLALAHSIELEGSGLALDFGVCISGADEDYSNIIFSFPANQGQGTEEFVPDKASLIDLKATVALPLPVRVKLPGCGTLSGKGEEAGAS